MSPVQNSAMSAAAVDQKESETFVLSNRGNKLTGEENPGMKRPKIWMNRRAVGGEFGAEEDDFEVQRGSGVLQNY